MTFSSHNYCNVNQDGSRRCASACRCHSDGDSTPPEMTRHDYPKQNKKDNEMNGKEGRGKKAGRKEGGKEGTRKEGKRQAGKKEGMKEQGRKEKGRKRDK